MDTKQSDMGKIGADSTIMNGSCRVHQAVSMKWLMMKRTKTCGRLDRSEGAQHEAQP